jgi:prepilin-type N-terminal cleavage/methylation domain-containing protein
MMSGLRKTPQRGIQNNEGFTLVELIVALAIAAICMGLIATILFSGSTMTASQLEKDSNKNLASNIMDFMKETIQYSSEEVLVKNTTPTLPSNQDYGWVFISNDGVTSAPQGFLYFRTKGLNNPPHNVFGQDFYNNKKIGLFLTMIDDDTFQITVTVYDSKGELLHQITDSISLTKKAFDPSMSGISPASGTFSSACILFR